MDPLKFKIGMLLFDAGALSMLFTALWFLVFAFRESPRWGFVVLFVPLVGGTLFLCYHWAEAKKPFLYQMLGFLLFWMGNVIALPEF